MELELLIQNPWALYYALRRYRDSVRDCYFCSVLLDGRLTALCRACYPDSDRFVASIVSRDAGYAVHVA